MTQWSGKSEKNQRGVNALYTYDEGIYWDIIQLTLFYTAKIAISVLDLRVHFWRLPLQPRTVVISKFKGF